MAEPPSATAGAKPPPPPTGAEPPPPPAADPLGTLVVTPGMGRPLPRLAIVPSLSAELADVLFHGVIRRDLDLSGEVELLADKASPPGETADQAQVDTAAWQKAGAEIVARVTAEPGAAAADEVALAAQLFLVAKGNTPVFDWRGTAKRADLRAESHRVADLLIGALTGRRGAFASRMAFTYGQGSQRTAYVIDADGHGVRAVSSPAELAIGAVIGPGGEPYWISSVRDEPYQVRTFRGPISPSVRGSVYGLAFSKDGGKVAVSIGEWDGIRVFAGADFASLARASEVRTALQPAFTPDGRLAFSGAAPSGQRIHVGGKAVSPTGIFAASPTFCGHPDGVIAIFAAGAGKLTDLVRMGESGGSAVRLTAGQGSNGAPACSPDGRLVAFFSTRTSGEGPGLYVMRVDGRRPRRISTFVGSSLHWGPLPSAPPTVAKSPGLVP